MTDKAYLTAKKVKWFRILYATVATLIIGSGVAFMIHGNHPQKPLEIGNVRLMSFVFLMEAIVLTSLKFRNKPSPVEFQDITLLGLIFAHVFAVTSLMMVFMGLPPLDYLQFPAAALAVELLFFLPLGLRYWASVCIDKGLNGTLAPKVIGN